MGKVISIIHGDRRYHVLDDVNAGKHCSELLSICTHGFCKFRDDCDIRDRAGDYHEGLGIISPITGCMDYECESEDIELELDF